MSQFVEELRAAFGAARKTETFLYGLDDDKFYWKRQLSSGFIAKCGEIKVQKAPVFEVYATILDKSLDVIENLHEQVGRFQEERSVLIRDRDTALVTVKEIAALKEEWESKLYGRFVAILNAKKERIQMLEEDMGLNTEDHEKSHTKKSGGGIKNSSDRSEEENADYNADTDVDSEVNDDAGDEQDSTSPPPSGTLRRCHDIFDSFESPGSPVPILPKRARGTIGRKEASPEHKFNGSRQVMADKKSGFASSSNFSDPEEEGTRSLKAAENTQDLLDDF